MTGTDTALRGTPPEIESQRLAGRPRWVVYAGRAAFWILLVALVTLGIVGVVRGQPGDPAAADGQAWPVDDARTLALVEADRWLTNGPATASSGIDTSTLAIAALDLPAEADRGSVTVAARLTDPRGWVHIAVPVHRSGGHVGLAGTPALVATPPEADPVGRSTDGTTADPEIAETVEGWAAAYAEGGSELARWMSSENRPVGLTEHTTFDEVTSVRTVDGTDDGTVTVLADVRWRLEVSDPLDEETSPTGPKLQQTYRLTLLRDDGRWYVQRVDVGYPIANDKEN